MASSTKTQASTKDKATSTQDTEQKAAVAVRASEQLTGEVMNVRTYEEDELRSISNFDEAITLASAANEGIEDAAREIGDGFALLDQDGKGRLVGVPLLFMEWSFYDGDFGAKFVAARVVVRNPDGGVSKYIINDGSTGICDVLAKYQMKTGRTGGLLCRNGLRRSDYTYCDMCDAVVNPQVDVTHASDHKKATTFYLDTSA